MMDQDKFDVAFLGLCVTFGQKDNVKELAQVNFKYLNDRGFTDEDFECAVNHVMATHVYNTLPKPAELISGVKGDSEAQALLAIEKLVGAMSDHGPYVSIIFDDPILMDVVKIIDGGWPGLCALTFDELVWVKKDLIKAYLARLSTGHYSKEPAPLVGITEATNAISGYERTEPIVMVGDKAKCKMLIAQSEVKQIARDERAIVKLRGEG